VELGFYKELLPKLPHPPISLRILLIVEAAIRTAWGVLREGLRTGFDLASAMEDPITHELYEVLYDDVFATGLVEGFDRSVFTVVTREPNLRNYDGSSLDKQPDLLIGLVDRPRGIMRSQDWLFIECKPVDAGHTVGDCYCGKGLIRFVIGGYAWAMTEAMMVGYARGGYTITPKLYEALRKRSDTIPNSTSPTPCPHSEAASFSEPVHVTKHGRTFRYVETDTQAPDITIRHLWLKRD